MWDRVIGYMTFRYDSANATCIAWTSWASLQQADAQTATNETESMMQTHGQHTIIFIISIRQAYLSSADAARSPIAVFDLEMSW